jgi:hypothetical protein
LMGSTVSSVGEFAPIKGSSADGAPPAATPSGGEGLI